MTRVLVVADEAWTRNDVHASLTTPDYELVDTSDPRAVTTLLAESPADVVVADLQVGAMGGMALARSVREMATTSDKTPTPVVLLLDRRADEFLAGRSGAAAWVVKPFTARDLQAAVGRALAVDEMTSAE